MVRDRLHHRPHIHTAQAQSRESGCCQVASPHPLLGARASPHITALIRVYGYGAALEGHRDRRGRDESAHLPADIEMQRQVHEG